MSLKTTASIYVLFDPRNPKVPKYVGQTSTPLRQRLFSHLVWAYQTNKSPFAEWLIGLDRENVLPSIALLETCDWQCRLQREAHWINFYRPLESLFNAPAIISYKAPKTRARPKGTKRCGYGFVTSKSRPVLIVETGQKFASVTYAARALGVYQSTLDKALHRGGSLRGLTPKFTTL